MNGLTFSFKPVIAGIVSSALLGRSESFVGISDTCRKVRDFVHL
jgi:hypothetical protein